MSKKVASAIGVVQPMLPALLGQLASDYAPRLGSLLYNERIPDRHLNVLLDWSGIIQSDSPAGGFEKDALIEVLHSLNIALLSSYAFAPYIDETDSAPDGKVHLDLFDLGDAVIVERTRATVSIVAAGLHGEDGVAFVRSADDELRSYLDAISKAVADAI